jgi:hypothetical protein
VRAHRRPVGSLILSAALLVAPAAAGEAADAAFGSVLAISGDTVVVGSSESAWVFVRAGDGFQLEQRLVPSDESPIDSFGATVAISGDTVVVGAPHQGSTVHPGAAYVFVRTGSAWAEQAKLVASDASAADRFGASVAVGGDVVFVGAPGSAVAGRAEQGKAYAFVRSGGAWSEAQTFTAADGVAYERFGRAVAASETGETLMVGVPGARILGQAVGAAYVYARSGSAWLPQQKLAAPDGLNGDQFGWAVSASGDTAVAGTYADNGSNMGSAYVFARTAGAWSLQQKLRDTSVPPLAWCGFGSTVALAGDTLVVGDYAGEAQAASVFTRQGASWTLQASLRPADIGLYGDAFAWAVAASPQDVLVGAPDDQIAERAYAGSAYAFARDAVGWREQAKLTMPRPPLAFYTLQQCRLVDTRGAPGVPIGGPALEGGTTREIWLAEHGYCGIPADARALALNVTVTGATAAGHVRLYPAGSDAPQVSAVNHGAGQTRASQVVLPFDRRFVVFAAHPAGATAHLVIDVSGYFR